MSKAFTRESDDSTVEETPLTRRQFPTGTRNLITREGADRLRQRMADLLRKRDEATATSAGRVEDLIQKRKLEHSIHHLQDILNTIEIADIPIDRSKVGFGATVVVGYGDGREEAFRIVGFDEADPAAGSINWLSPLAKALLSKRTGDRLQFREQELKILNVSY